LTSAVSFARDHASTWRSLTPTADIYIRRVNSSLYEREYVPLDSKTSPKRRALINEVGFKLFSLSLVESWGGNVVPKPVIARAFESVRKSYARLSGTTGRRIVKLSDLEIRESLDLLGRLRQFFIRTAKGKKMEFSPQFSGCGILDTSAGDVCFGESLFEVKAGDRSFRSVDVRQLLIYAALNKASGARKISQLGLFNPRTGVSFVSDLDDLCIEISGRPSGDLLAEIIRIVSSGDISR